MYIDMQIYTYNIHIYVYVCIFPQAFSALIFAKVRGLNKSR